MTLGSGTKLGSNEKWSDAELDRKFRGVDSASKNIGDALVQALNVLAKSEPLSDAERKALSKIAGKLGLWS